MSVFKIGDQLLDMIQDRYPGYHPILHAADIAHDPDASITVQMDAVKVMLKYTTPDIRSIDVSHKLVDQGQDRLEIIAFGLEDLRDGRDVVDEDRVHTVTDFEEVSSG